jgi:hypothetical protein
MRRQTPWWALVDYRVWFRGKERRRGERLGIIRVEWKILQSGIPVAKLKSGVRVVSELKAPIWCKGKFERGQTDQIRFVFKFVSDQPETE